VFKSTTFKKYLLPGFVFQSVVIAGGYGTGRELVEFFLSYGPLGGLLAMVLVSTVIWSVVCASSFEFARLFRSYDYRTFFTHLLGPGWPLFEICYFLLLLIILAVIAAAAGTVLQETFGLSYASGVLGMMAAVGYLVFRGSATIERVLAGWSFVLYSIYVILFVWSLTRFGGATLSALTAGQVTTGWMIGGVRYAAYNLAIIPAVLFAVRHAESRREAVTAGLLTGPIAIVPGLMFYLVMCGQYPQILGRAVPANFILELLGSRTFQIVFQIVLFGTLIETGAGLIHAVNERVAGAFSEKNRSMPTYLRPLTALILLVLGTLLSGFGLIDLIAKGYGTLTWFFLAIFASGRSATAKVTDSMHARSPLPTETQPAPEVRPLVTSEDYAQCVDLQRDTWGRDFAEIVPPALLQVSQKVGGVAAGAFDEDDRLIGFVYGVSGIRLRLFAALKEGSGTHCCRRCR
jgi:uncharacterized membrane protein YkvI